MKRLLLLGGGHAHVHVLQELARAPLPGCEVMLVTPFARQFYSGMLPGFVAGYLAGVLAKAVFACSFAWLAPRWGLAPAMALALAAGGAAALVVTHWRHGAMGPTLPAVAAARRH